MVSSGSLCSPLFSGGYTTGPGALVSLLRQRARPYLFSNSLPPASVGCASKALDLLMESNAIVQSMAAKTLRCGPGQGGASWGEGASEGLPCVPAQAHNSLPLHPASAHLCVPRGLHWNLALLPACPHPLLSVFFFHFLVHFMYVYFFYFLALLPVGS